MWGLPLSRNPKRQQEMVGLCDHIPLGILVAVSNFLSFVVFWMAFSYKNTYWYLNVCKDILKLHILWAQSATCVKRKRSLSMLHAWTETKTVEHRRITVTSFSLNLRKHDRYCVTRARLWHAVSFTHRFLRSVTRSVAHYSADFPIESVNNAHH